MKVGKFLLPGAFFLINGVRFIAIAKNHLTESLAAIFSNCTFDIIRSTADLHRNLHQLAETKPSYEMKTCIR